MHTSTSHFSLISLIRQFLMIVGFLLFIFVGSDALRSMDNQAAVQGVDNPQTGLQTVTLLPR